ncbi:MAG: hypothetical protein K0R15_2788 [Clostridiales bacterium]|jgi:RimJ/RimL family protein N-acetyltransferase|nr:hypothetical protein [Clostridiales bacterium]
MIRGIEIGNMQDTDIGEAKQIWVRQYELHCNQKDFPTYWKEDTSLLEGFLSDKVKDEKAIVAKLGGKVVGFLAFDEFPFNGEDSVFCPAIGHSAVEEYKESVYLELYKSISQKWVNRNIFNHMWTIFINDEKLKKILFDLGYGSYLIDAFTNCHNNYSRELRNNDIRQATIIDKEALHSLVIESNEYYATAPLFLKREEVSGEEIEELIRKKNVLIAMDQEKPIGFLNISICNENDFINLTTEGNGLLDEIGIFIKPEYRNKDIGLGLLMKAMDYCKQLETKYIHVDFETANLYANKFWIKYFSPMLLSMRRTINKNINDK